MFSDEEPECSGGLGSAEILAGLLSFCSLILKHGAGEEFLPYPQFWGDVKATQGLCFGEEWCWASRTQGRIQMPFSEMKLVQMS